MQAAGAALPELNGVRLETEATPEVGERDFGSIELEGERYFWKIDYYDRSLRFGAEDPSDTTETMRVLTLMHGSEY